MKRNEKGFTLIELLAVIVILGLLMAIAIPSVTKYITQSRVKTLTKTMDSYITAVVQEVNDGDYKFSDGTKIYAIPIECVSLEKGGTNPFGEWMQANDNYWAYVLVHYDSKNYNYEYGFTFKDDAGYGLYPTKSDKITNSMIRTGYNDLTQPKDGFALNFVASDKWEGFTDISSSTELVVLESTSEGDTGDGIDTCTLCQKGDNYEDIEQEKIEFVNDRTLISKTGNNGVAFWQYRSKIINIIFQNNINIPSEISDEHKWDISITGNNKLMAYIVQNKTYTSKYDLYIQGDGKIYANPDSSRLFEDFLGLESIKNIELFDTSNVTNMSRMFARTGRDNKKFTINLGDNFDTSNVTDMSLMFALAGYKSPVFTLNLGNKFDTSNVTNMQQMFDRVGYSSEIFTLDLGDKFDTSNVTNMKIMFGETGHNSKVFTLDLGNKFDTSNVTIMRCMFMQTGYSSELFTLNLGDKFDTSNVTDMAHMFSTTGKSSPIFTLKLGDKFDTSNVKNMEGMFFSTGYSNDSFRLDCRNWNVSKVKVYSNFNKNVETKIIPPIWVH